LPGFIFILFSTSHSSNLPRSVCNLRMSLLSALPYSWLRCWVKQWATNGLSLVLSPWGHCGSGANQAFKKLLLVVSVGV